MTSVGAILGTAAYMSPEQTRGRAVDKRTDIWAFGCVLYELLTGRLAYRGETVSDLVAAILEREPDWRALPNATPQNVRRLLRRCLEKDPKQRLHDVADARLELEEVLTAPPPPVSGSEIVAPVRPERWTIRRVARSALAAAGGLGVGAGLATALLVATGRWGGSEESIETRFQVLPPPGASFEGPLAVSPDGHWLAFVALSGGEARLWVRPRNSVIAQSLEGTAGARSPFWSPDSRSIAFFAAGRLKRIVLSGGLPQSIADAANPTGGTWSRDDVILFVPYNEVALYRIAAGGGELIRVPSVDRSGQVLVPNHPYFLSDGRHFLYYGRSPRPERSGIYLGSLDSGESDLLLGGIAETKVAYSPPGYLLFMREEALVAQPFDERHLTLAGKPLQAAERIAYDEANYASFAASATGVLAYWGASRRNGQIVLFDRSGNRLGHIGQTGEYSAPSLSPDQSQLAVEHLGEDRHTIWLIDWQRQLPSRFATYAWGVHHPVWSPDGRWIAYVGGREGLQLHRKAVNADTPDEQLTFSTAVARPNDWTGNVLVYEQVDPGTGWDIWYLPFVTPRKPVPFLQTPFNEVQGHLSPDGKWLAYTSDESGTLEAYVQSFPLAGDKRRVSIRGGAQPKWRSDGKELFYLSGDRHLMVAQVRSRSPFVLGDPQPLFATGIRGTIAIAAASNNNYAVTSDGQRFYVNTSVEQSNIAPITVVLNWTRSLRQ